MPNIPIFLRIRKHIKPKVGPIRLSSKMKEVTIITTTEVTKYTIICRRNNCIGYDIMAIVMDKEGRKNATKTHIPVKGVKTRQSGITVKGRYSKLEGEGITIELDKEEYEIGDIAIVSITSPFAPCDGLLTIRCNGIVKSITFKMDKLTSQVKINIIDDYAPSISLQVDLVGKSIRKNINHELVFIYLFIYLFK